MLELRECSARYGATTVLDPVSLRLETGRTGCIIGPSGCGKTTLLMLAAGLKEPAGGSVLLDGEPIARDQRRIALILQQYGLFPWFTAGDNVELGLRIRGLPAGERRAIAQRELARVGLADRGGSYPRELSGGQQQRVAIARAFALAPRLLLMDEPFSALDALSRETLQDVLLASVRDREASILLVTHSIEEAVYLGGTIWVLAGAPGRIVARFENPGQGARAYRGEPAFHGLCGEIRACMEGLRVI